MGAAAAVILRKQRDIVHVFQGARATSPETARIPDQLGIDENLVFKGLVRRAIVRPAGGGRYYVDEPSWNAMHTIRKRMLVVLMFALLMFIIFGLVTLR